MVWVFPDPVWPYAIRVQLYPWCKRSSSGAAMASNAAAWSQSPSIMLAKPSCTTDPSLGRWTKTPFVVAKTAGLSDGLMRTLTVTIAASSSDIARCAEPEEPEEARAICLWDVAVQKDFRQKTLSPDSFEILKPTSPLALRLFSLE